MNQAFKREWEAKGASDTTINLALKLAFNWAEGMARISAPGDLQLQQKIIENVYPTALNDVANNWIVGITRP